MANTTGAKKAHRQSLRRRVFNMRRAKTLKNTTKKVTTLISAGNKKEANESLSEAYKAIDKAAKRGIIKKNAANRKKSRLSQAIKKIA